MEKVVIDKNAIMLFIEKKYDCESVILPDFYLETAIDEISELKKHAKISIIRTGFLRPEEYEKKIFDIAMSEDATFVTTDIEKKKKCDILGIPVLFLKSESLSFEKYFDNSTMSVHLKENTTPKAKKGKPGQWKFAELSKKMMTKEEIMRIANEITSNSSYIEIEREGSTIVQLDMYRIVITKPPFSDGWEITIVRPVKHLSLEDYKLDENLYNRLNSHAEGILIAGAPGHGKSTFAQALAEHYVNQNKIVKTVEAPRDLVLPDTVTQYAISHGSNEEVHDILLLSRPDFTFFDEMRNTDDFMLYADMRLAGVGMVGVVHATMPIDAIQRMIGRIELGVIPQIIDTVIFIKDGFPKEILYLKMVVKVPEGMTEADLARPVVAVYDFKDDKLKYEIYTYGEQTVIIPVSKKTANTIHKLAEYAIREEFKRFVKNPIVKVETDNKCIVYVPKSSRGKIIGKEGKTIAGLEEKLGMSIDVKDIDEISNNDEILFEYKIGKNNLELLLSETNIDVDIFVKGEYLLTAKVSKKGKIKLTRKNPLGKILERALINNDDVRLERK